MKTRPHPIRVLVVDDSALARRAITEALSQDPEIEVVGQASDPYVARDRILALEPDVITLDLEMPRMDGLTFLKILQEHHPVPVVVVSSLTQAGSAKAMEAMEAGAMDVLGKPDGSRSLSSISREIAFHVKAAASATRRVRLPASRPAAKRAAATQNTAPGKYSPRKLLVIGASTGGVEALRFLLPRLPAGLPPIVVVQHIPAYFSRSLAEHLDKMCEYEVREAIDGDILRPGLCLIAPGDFHLLLQNTNGSTAVRLNQSPPIHYCRPAVDVLFRSAAEQAGKEAVGVLLTGMGVDGARGLQAMRAAGARTFAEDESSCVVFGMPQAAIKLGAAEQVLPLAQLPEAILNVLHEPVGRVER